MLSMLQASIWPSALVWYVLSESYVLTSHFLRNALYAVNTSNLIRRLGDFQINL